MRVLHGLDVVDQDIPPTTYALIVFLIVVGLDLHPFSWQCLYLLLHSWIVNVNLMILNI